MNKLVSYLARRAQRKKDDQAEKDFTEGFNGRQSNIEEEVRRLVRQDRLLNWVVAVFTVIGVIAAVVALLR